MLPRLWGTEVWGEGGGQAKTPNPPHEDPKMTPKDPNPTP